MPNSSCAPPRATRKPVMTSSNTSSAPTRSHSARRPARNPGSGGTRPMLAAIGSTMTHAVRSSSVGDDVVGRDHACPARRPSVTPAEPGQAERGQAAARLGQQQVAVAVVVAGELHHRRPAGEAPGDADGRHRRLGAARHQPHHLARRDPGADLLGQQHLALGRRAVAGAVGRGPLHGLDDGRVGVAGDDRPVRLHEVDVAACPRRPTRGRPRPGPRSRACPRRPGRPAPGCSRPRGSRAGRGRTARRWSARTPRIGTGDGSPTQPRRSTTSRAA